VGLVGMVLLAIIAHISEISRLYAYSMVFFVVFTVGHYLSFPFFYYPIMLGVTILVSGAYLLIRFLQRYPIPSGDKPDG